MSPDSTTNNQVINRWIFLYHKMPMSNVVFLPATAPGDQTYGVIPKRIQGYDEIHVRQVCYPRLVWYNQAVQEEAVAQILSWDLEPVILVGFSKSGLGAWNIARTIPGRVCATIIFDSPMARKTLPPWGTAPFYDDDTSWQRDLPLLSIRAFQDSMSANHRLVLISGEGFHDEMSEMSRELQRQGCAHNFLPRPQLKHHWNSGWVEEGIAALG